MSPDVRPEVELVTTAFCPTCHWEQSWDSAIGNRFDGSDLGNGPGRLYTQAPGGRLALQWEAYPGFRCRCRIGHDLLLANERIATLDAFGRRAGAVFLHDREPYAIHDGEESEALAVEYLKLFPPEAEIVEDEVFDDD